MSITEEEKQKAIKGRDDFNFQYDSLRHIPEFKDAQDYMNRTVNGVLYPAPDPPDPPDPPQIYHKFFHLDALGIFLDILEHEDFDRVEEVISKASFYGCSACSFFMWLDDNKPEHRNLKGKIPWKISNNKVDFDKPDNDWYWPLYRRFLEMLKKYNIQPLPQAFMWKYTFYHFENNSNGIKSFFDQPALKYQKWMAWRTLVEQERLGIKPRIKFINEPNHGGRCEGPGRGHWIANWHRDMWEHARDKGLMTKLEDLVIDISESEFASAQLVWHSGDHVRCTKCGVYEWDNKEEYDRNALREQHGVSIITDLERDHVSLDVFIKNLHNWQIKWSEDGSRYGNIVPVPGLPWRQGDALQVYEMLKKAWGDCEASTRKKHLYWGIHPKECLRIVNDIFVDYWDAQIINWDRFLSADVAHAEIFGS